MCCAACRWRSAPANRSGCSGRNGMGKTTLIRTLLGLTPASARQGARARPRLHARGAVTGSRGWASRYVPEGRGIFPNLSVRENLLLAERAAARHARRLDLRARARRVSAPARNGSRFGGQQLSGGEQQMLAIGRALMTNPGRADPRRGDRGSRAADRARDLAHRRRDPPERHRVAARRSQLPAGARATPIARSSWRKASSCSTAGRRRSRSAAKRSLATSASETHLTMRCASPDRQMSILPQARSGLCRPTRASASSACA